MLRMTIPALALALAAPAVAADRPVEIIGHRGASHDAPENTVASVRLAWDQKADAAEFDIYLTKDRKIVVIHDKDTKRTAGGMNKVVAESTLAELRALDVGKWKGEKFAGEKIPTLDEVLATVPAGRRVFIEVKTGPEIVPELDAALKASKLPPAQTPVISFNAASVAAMKKARPDVPAYWIVSLGAKGKAPAAETLIAKAKEIHADGLDLSASEALDEPYAKAVKAAGLKLYVWTVNDPAVARRMVTVGVDGITTDRPGWLREQLAK
ncbi:MAG TPA: glycerophosphodiester phosphodiesterase [Urbifossiella sp.]|jgi:glycerophosphoryl diester phosphodiesterase|nr:glycerophosphodiester phosphodiesterase [Urbifossiella sp.]